MNFTQIRNMIAVAECQSISGAAEKLHVAQPAITKSIKTLESELGAELFYRGTQGMTLTPYGEAWLRHAKVIKSELNRGALELQKMREGVKEHFTVSGAPIVMPKLLPEAIACTRKELPNVTICVLDVASMNRKAQDQAFQDGTLDIALSLIEPNDDIGTQSKELLLDVELKILVRKGHPLLKKRNLSLSDIKQQHWIGAPTGNRVRQLMDYEFGKRGIQLPPPQIETANPQVRNHLLVNTDLIGFLGYHPACVDMDTDNLELLPLTVQMKPWSIGIITPPGSILSPSAERFLSHIRAVVDKSTHQ